MYRIRFYWLYRATASRRAEILPLLHNVIDISVIRHLGRQRVVYGAYVAKKDYPRILRYCHILMCISGDPIAISREQPESPTK